MVHTFDDFDAWGDVVRGAELQIVCDRVEVRRWTIGALALGRTVVQVAEEGGGNLCHGVGAHPGTVLFLPLARVEGHVVNGERLDGGSLLAIPHGADFHISVRRTAHAWCSIALPLAFPGGRSRRIAPGTEAVERLKRAALRAVAGLAGVPAGSPAHAAAEEAILAAAEAVLLPGAPRAAPAGRPKIDRMDLLGRMMALLEGSSTAILSPAALAAALGVHERTLQRVVRETVGTTTKEYLLLRALHAARRRLRRPPDAAEGVTGILAGLGIWEFGRFAGRYRAHFGEPPSSTLAAARGEGVSCRGPGGR